MNVVLVHTAAEPADDTQLCEDCGCMLQDHSKPYDVPIDTSAPPREILLGAHGVPSGRSWWEVGARVAVDGRMSYVVVADLDDHERPCTLNG